jgi:hypothetical protein
MHGASRLFAIFFNSDFAHASIYWFFGWFVLYIISPKDFSAVAWIGPFFILMQACFNQA